MTIFFFFSLLLPVCLSDSSLANAYYTIHIAGNIDTVQLLLWTLQKNEKSNDCFEKQVNPNSLAAFPQWKTVFGHARKHCFLSFLSFFRRVFYQTGGGVTHSPHFWLLFVLFGTTFFCKSLDLHICACFHPLFSLKKKRTSSYFCHTGRPPDAGPYWPLRSIWATFFSPSSNSSPLTKCQKKREITRIALSNFFLSSKELFSLPSSWSWAISPTFPYSHSDPPFFFCGERNSGGKRRTLRAKKMFT